MTASSTTLCDDVDEGGGKTGPGPHRWCGTAAASVRIAYSSGSLTSGGSSSWSSSSSPSSSSSSSSSSLGFRGGGELLTSVQLINQVETYLGMCGIMLAPVLTLRRFRGYARSH